MSYEFIFSFSESKEYPNCISRSIYSLTGWLEIWAGRYQNDKYLCWELIQVGSTCFNKHNTVDIQLSAVLYVHWAVLCLYTECPTLAWSPNIIKHYHADWRRGITQIIGVINIILARIAEWAIYSFIPEEMKFQSSWGILCLLSSLPRSYQHNNQGPLPNNSLNF